MKVWILEKIWFDRYGYEKSKCYSFDSFRAANRAVFDDVTDEYITRDCQHDNADGFYTEQARPFEDDTEANLKFRDESRIDWVIHETDLESEGGLVQ